MSGVRCQVSCVRGPVSGVRCQGNHMFSLAYDVSVYLLIAPTATSLSSPRTLTTTTRHLGGLGNFPLYDNKVVKEPCNKWFLLHNVLLHLHLSSQFVILQLLIPSIVAYQNLHQGVLCLSAMHFRAIYETALYYTHINSYANKQTQLY